MKKSISDFSAGRKAEVEFRTDRMQAALLDVFEYRIANGPQLSELPVVYEVLYEEIYCACGDMERSAKIKAQSTKIFILKQA